MTTVKENNWVLDYYMGDVRYKIEWFTTGFYNALVSNHDPFCWTNSDAHTQWPIKSLFW